MSLGHKLKYLRKQEKLTQPVIAEILNVAINTYSQYENDIRKPSFELLRKLSEFYKVDTMYFTDKQIDDEEINRNHDDILKLEKEVYEYRLFRMKVHNLNKTIDIYIDQINSDDELEKIEAKAYLEHAKRIYDDVLKDSKVLEKVIYLDDLRVLIGNKEKNRKKH